MTQFFKYIYVLFFSFASYGATELTDDMNLVNSLNDSSYYLGSSFPERALDIANQSLVLAKKINYPFGEITAYCRKGNALIEMDELNLALQNYNQAEYLFNQSQEDSILLAKIFIYQSPIYRKKGMIDKALSNYNKAFKIAERQKDGVLIGSTLLNISLIYKSQGDYKRALNFLHHAVEVLPAENKDELGAVHNSIGNIYQNERRINEAIIEYRTALSFFTFNNNLNATLKANINIGNCFWDLDRVDSALFFYNKALPIAIRQSFKETESIIYQNKGAIFTEKQMLDSADFYFKKSLDIKKIDGDADGQLETLKSIGEIAFLRNNIDEAIGTYKQAYQLALAFNYLEDLEEITRQLSACYQNKNDWDKTINYLELSKTYKDSITEKLNDALIYEINYEQEKRKATELALLVKKRDRQLERRNSLILWGAAIALLLILIFFILFKLNKFKRKNVEIEKKNIEKEKEIGELISQREQAELSAMYNGQESERNRISTELHDNLGGILSTVKLYFRAIDKQINLLKDENVQQYQKANELLDKACDQTRTIAHQLSSKKLNNIGLYATVKNRQREINDSGQIKFVLNTHGKDDELKKLDQISIYRIIQELINNILKHAKATEINMQLNVFDTLFNMIIEDDGIGFDLNLLINNTGIGLRETKARVKNMNGTFSIDSGRGGGTTITIDIPLKKEE